MFLDNPNLFVSSYWTAFWTEYHTAIMAYTLKWFKDEDIDDRSCKQYRVNQYFYAFYLGLLIKNEMYSSVFQSYDYYNDKYGLEIIKKNLACNGISLNKIYTIFGIVFTDIPILPYVTVNTDEVCTSIFTCEEIIVNTVGGCSHCGN